MNNSIIETLYHRPPYLYLDEIIESDQNMAMASRKLVGDEPFFLGHFPGSPVVPGAMMCEMTFQTSCYWISKLLDGEKIDRSDLAVGVVTGIQRAKFKGFLRPGDLIKIKVEPIERIDLTFRMKGTITRGNELVMSNEFTATCIKENILLGSET